MQLEIINDPHKALLFCSETSLISMHKDTGINMN